MKPIQVLYIEDNIIDFQTLERSFHHATLCQVVLEPATLLSEAIERLSHHSYWDVILLDLHLPDSWGLRTLTRLHKLVPHIPIIVVTGFEDETLSVDAASAGAQDCIIKGSHIMPPFSSERRREGANHLVRLLIYSIERMQLSERLRQMENQYIQERELSHLTLRSIGDAVITLDGQGHVKTLNPAAELLTGWIEHEAQGKSIADICLVKDDHSHPAISGAAAHTTDLAEATIVPRSATMVCRNQRQITVSSSASPLHSKDGSVVGTVLVLHDISAEHNRTQRLEWQAHHDPLTHLLNRPGFVSRLEMLFASPATNPMANYCLCYCDLDYFKIINDTCGHSAGDELLKQIADLLTAAIRPSDIVARLGGDEFVILLRDCNVEDASNLANRLCQRINQYRFVWKQNLFRIGASIGIVELDALNFDIMSALQMADRACYTAKNRGKGQAYLHPTAPDESVSQPVHETRWFSRITQALEENQFRLYHQQIISTHTEQPLQMSEVLIRLEDQTGTIVPPSAFMASAERYQLSAKIDRYVIESLFKHLTSRSQYSDTYCINLSGVSISDDSFVDSVLEYFEKYPIAPEKICFEITETAAIRNLVQASRSLHRLRKIGCRFALDDFGSGMSSLAYLKQLPVDFLKIDGVFVKDICHDPVTCTLVEMINKVAHTLNLKTVAEHVESSATLNKLKQLGVDYVQGYLLGRPCALA